MKQISPINMPKIQNEISKKHKAFISNFGPIIQKVIADNRLLTDLVATRIYHILLCFREEGIIDHIKSLDGYPRKTTLSKDGFDNYVNILTNGRTVRIEGYNFVGDDFKSDVELPGQNYHNVNEQDYDWEKFSIELLDYIHTSIYDRKDALEAKISGTLGDPSRN